MLKVDIGPLSKFDYTLDAALRELTTLEGRAVARHELRQAMKLMINDSKGRVHSITGHLASAINFRFTGSFDSTQIAEMGVSYKRTRARHAHLVEGGHKGPKPADPHPFWAPAVEAKSQAVLDALESAVEDALDDTLMK